MNIVGLTRVRNESEIMQDTLDHMSTFCTGGIYVFDDVSTDNTVAICKAHPAVRGIVENKVHQKDRDLANTENRQRLWLYAKQFIDISCDWVIYMDADERVEFDFTQLEVTRLDAYKFRLFDFYITPEDLELRYDQRRWCGPEYRDILFLFRASCIKGWIAQAARQPDLSSKKIKVEGYVKHYGKAISVEQWEETCDYYSGSSFPVQKSMRPKWLARKGKAVHKDGVSDFGWPLIEWHEKETKGVPMGTKYKKV